MIQDLCSKIKNNISEVLSKPPEHEQITLDDGFCCLVTVKPKYSLTSLGYDHTKLNATELMDTLKSVITELNEYYNEGGIRIQCYLPNKKTKDFVFEIGLD